MGNLCVDIAVDFVNFMHGKDSKFSPDGHISIFVDEFKKCKDFPRQPEVVEFEMNFNRMLVFDYEISEKLDKKRWSVVATEIIE